MRDTVKNRSMMNLSMIGIYCGVPQALECFRVAREVLEETGPIHGNSDQAAILIMAMGALTSVIPRAVAG